MPSLLITGSAVLLSLQTGFHKLLPDLRDMRPSIGQMQTLGYACFIGGAAGAVVGSMPVITTWGTVVTPYTLPKGRPTAAWLV